MSASSSRRKPLALLVLAAGKGTRLAVGDDAPPKVLVECLGAPLLEHVRLATKPLEPDVTAVVVGHQHERVRAWMEDAWAEAVPVLQEPQNGTGHAVRLALEALPDFEGTVLVVYGDVPQLRTEDLEALLERHRRKEAAASVLTGIVADAGSLGRVVRGADGGFREIVEAKDAVARPEVLAIREFNSGIYAFDAAALRPAVEGLSRENAQGEEYATDAVGRIAATGAVVEAVVAQETESLLGVNDGRDLAGATTLLRRRIASDHMRRGVTIVDPDTTVIEVGVEIEAGARILPFTYIQRGCRVAAGAVVGPFARLRGAAVLEEGAEVGNFVEVKKSTLGPGAKAKHLTYLGDAIVGAKVNVGCGTITANYDGVRKHPTTIEAGARIGSGTVLVAPVTVGEGAVTGANAVVLPGRDVPAGRTAVGVPSRLLANRDDETSPGGSA